VTAGAAFGVGANANALIGGSNNSFALQPVSFEGQTGVNVASGRRLAAPHPARGAHASCAPPPSPRRVLSSGGA